MSTHSVEVVYRGIFQRHLAQKICRGIVLAAVKEGKRGIAFGRYGDSPERNGIPAKQFAIVADTEEELQISMAQYEPKETDVSIAVDDTLCKGVESWAWYGLQPINKLLKKDGTLVVTSMEEPDALLEMTHTKEVPYHIAMVKGTVSFSGLWVYRDDHTDVRVLGAVAKVAPQLVRISSVEQAILEEWGDELKVKSARKSYDRTEKRLVAPGAGNPETPYTFEMPKWQEMREGLVIPAIPVREQVENWDGGYRPGRNPTFKKFSTRTMRPVVDFEKCTKCTLCWLQCPDSCFDITPDGFYDANMQACCGCGVCEAVCPVENCITMVNETAFQDNASQWEAWQKDKEGYQGWVQKVITNRPPRSHGFSHVTQYKRELAELRKAEDQAGQPATVAAEARSDRG